MFLTFFCRPLIVVASCITCYGISLGPFAVYADEHDRVIYTSEETKFENDPLQLDYTEASVILELIPDGPPCLYPLHHFQRPVPSSG
jgi:hypothetical protein